MKPVIADFLKNQTNKIKFIKINVEKNPKIAAKYKVMSLPTFLVFSDGKVVGQITGVTSLQKLEKKLNSIL